MMVPYRIIRHPRARSIKIRIDRDGAVRISAPSRASDLFIEQFIGSHEAWINTTRDQIIAKGKTLIAWGTRQDYLRYKEEARRVTLSRLGYWGAQMDLRWKQITIRNQKNVWGSCSRAGNLNFNWRIALLPSELTDYLIVHELAHLVHPNHSKQFWSFVGLQMPEYKKLRIALRTAPSPSPIFGRGE